METLQPYRCFVSCSLVWLALYVTRAFAADAPPASSNAAPNTLTVDAVVEEVVRLNPELDFYRAEITAAKAGRRTAAQWNNPEKLTTWADTLPKDQDIVLYCVRGGSISNSVVDALQAKGLEARFIEGGIEGWKAAGGEVVAK